MENTTKTTGIVATEPTDPIELHPTGKIRNINSQKDISTETIRPVATKTTIKNKNYNMDTKQNLLQVIDIQAGAKSLTEPLNRMFLDHCYRQAEISSSNNTEIISSYEQIKEIIERAFEFSVSEQTK